MARGTIITRTLEDGKVKRYECRIRLDGSQRSFP